MNYFINDSIHIKNRKAAMEFARLHSSEVFIYDAIGLYKILDSGGTVKWERK